MLLPGNHSNYPFEYDFLMYLIEYCLRAKFHDCCMFLSRDMAEGNFNALSVSGLYTLPKKFNRVKLLFFLLQSFSLFKVLYFE